MSRLTANDICLLVESATGKAPRKNQRGYLARCPAHDDRAESLSIREGDKGVLLNCFQGCRFKDICDALGVEPQRLFKDYGDTSKTPEYRPSKAERERFEEDTLIVYFYNERNNYGMEQDEEEHKSKLAAEERLRAYVQRETKGKDKARHRAVYSKRRHHKTTPKGRE